MGRVLPKGSVVQKMGKDIHVEVGDSVYIRDLLPDCHCEGSKQKQVIAFFHSSSQLCTLGPAYHFGYCGQIGVLYNNETPYQSLLLRMNHIS